MLRYGNTRALVLGVEVVLASGEIWDGLRGLRKDNTGYDLKHLFIGAEGTLGIITAAVLKLFPKPTARETAFLAVPDPAASVRLARPSAREAGRSHHLVRADREAVHRLGRRADREDAALRASDAGGPHMWHVLMEVSGQGAADSLREPLETALAAAMEAGLVTDAVMAQTRRKGAASGRCARTSASCSSASARASSTTSPCPSPRSPSSSRGPTRRLAKAYPGIRFVTFGHAGDGNIHYNPVAPANWDGKRFYAEREKVNRIVHDIIADLNGSISAEHGIGRLRMDEMAHYKSAVEMDLMRTLKRTLDPLNILNPGKVVRI